MNTEDMRLIRRVEGQRGSVSLYRYRDGLVEVVKVIEEGTDLIELRRHDLGLEPELLSYLAEVQVGIDGLNTKALTKRKGILKSNQPTAKHPQRMTGGMT